MSKKVIITGASGLLGRAIADVLSQTNSNDGSSKNEKAIGNFQVQRWVFNRLKDERIDRKVDIANKDAVDKAVDEFKPDVIIHSAAIRAPDVVDKQQDFSKGINVRGSEYVAEAAARHKAKLIYISTDYVFDGTSPPYSESARPNPLNEYGRQKLDGERAVLEKYPAAIILRVPILYGPVEYLGEGAVDAVLKSILSRDKPAEMSDYERRYPTHVEDVARIIRLLLAKHFQDGETIEGIYHWSGDEEMTKYDMCKSMADVFSLPIDHLTPNPNKPSGEQGAQRPYNAKLGRERMVALGASNKFKFADGIRASLSGFVGQK